MASLSGLRRGREGGGRPGGQPSISSSYRKGLSEKREEWRYSAKIYPQWLAVDPFVGPYQVRSTELISTGLEWLESEPETLFVEVPAFADFMLRRVVLRS